MKNEILVNEKLLTTSLIISKGANKDHHSVYKLIKLYVEDLKDFGVVRIGFHKPKTGRPLEFAYLNEEQTAFLIMLMRNNKEVLQFKKKITHEFFRMRKALAQTELNKQNSEWLEKRKQGKIARRLETDTIKEFVNYATNQGSKNANKYYANISKMENKSLFFIEGKYPNIRELLSGHQLSIIENADRIIELAIKEGMDKEMFYKDIYRLAKERIEKFSELIGKTIIPMKNNLIK